jgi:Cu/Ag efflux pump CusA
MTSGALRTHPGWGSNLFGDIAEISIGGDFRRGALDVDGREVVGGVVIMRTGENAMQVIQRVKERLADIAPSLPKGITIVPFYDRSGLIDRTIETLRGFVQEVQERIAREIKLPAGVTLKWSGQYESQLSAQRTLMLIVPVVLLIIFMLLSVVFRSVMEAAHVILAVPFALTGGAILQYLLGYNFSVAVWIAYIALFGTAIQTGVVMVVYLEEALRKRMEEGGKFFSLQDLKTAVLDGAMLRLRPKVMTVGTVVASLLPIMWSTRTGAEIMKPLATPVIGGMLSSLLHVLIVTPVIFYWLRRKALKV